MGSLVKTSLGLALPKPARVFLALTPPWVAISTLQSSLPPSSPNNPFQGL